MSIRTPEEYRDSLRQLNTEIWAFGEKISDVVDHPLFVPHVNAVAATYEFSLDPTTEDLMLAESHLTSKKISRFNHIHQSVEDLLKKVKMLRMINQKTACCIQRCAGMDSLNTGHIVTYDIDQKYGTNYHERFNKYIQKVQDENIVVIGAMTDVKGNRALKPSKQKDPDLYLHVVEEREDGIVVKGAKAHLTGVTGAHEVLVFPTAALKDDEKDYAVVFSMPVDTPGVTYIFGRQSNDTRKTEQGEIDKGNAQFATVGGECIAVFDNVFVPWESVYMHGETDFAGKFVEIFAASHRQNYGACKGGIADVLIGATYLTAKYNGVETASHIKDKLVEMIHLVETLYSGSIACSSEGHKTASGAYLTNILLANVTKQNTTRLVYEIGRIAQDIGGGILATQPAEEDFRHPEIGGLIDKYLVGVDGVPTEARLRVHRLIECLSSGTALVEAMHGAGSPQAQRVFMLRQGNLGYKEKLATKIAGIDSLKN
ncbi:4-hydroxybutyryl-CoA dehydratase [Metallumcola ferriviriculae]|uniref:4-hydroxybutyryl-CoA dehydratase n=1 Tax=Metallumcola ferriviriculae TaxID=3039180 RepID=A0AAU0UP39_9FIRM|nr:4-hydroxybutyryl-CoA dehydratase [Desulfitibacteraceae bacterium MK1]